MRGRRRRAVGGGPMGRLGLYSAGGQWPSHGEGAGGGGVQASAAASGGGPAAGDVGTTDGSEGRGREDDVRAGVPPSV